MTARRQTTRLHILSRVALGGLVLVLGTLATFCLWAVAATQTATQSATEAYSRSQDFAIARYTLAVELATQRDYWLEREPWVRTSLAPAAAAVEAALGRAGLDPEADDQHTVTHLLAQHRRYRAALPSFLAAVAAGDNVRARRINDQTLEPLVRDMEQMMASATDAEAQEALDAQQTLERFEQDVRTAATVVALLGLALLVLCRVILRRYGQERALLERSLAYQAQHDALTTLPNRSLLQQRLEQELSRARHDVDAVALLLLDLDRFKEVNDTWGHQCGDLLLRQTAQRLLGIVRATDMIARLGGDEFAVLLPGVTVEVAEQVAQALVVAVAEPFLIAEQSFRVGVSIGIAIAPEQGDSATILLQHADIAMYKAKRAGGGYACFRGGTVQWEEDQAGTQAPSAVGPLWG